jgi:acyl-coenzyme A thioesterase PaaI-like protein
VHVGRSFILVAVEVTDDDGRLVAQVTQTQAVLS